MHSLKPALQSSGPMVIAHRGGSLLAPENTIQAFDQALAMGADAIELDVRFSHDRVPVILHDPTLDRTTNQKGPVHEFAAKDLSVPKLKEVLERYPGTRIVIEIKEDGEELATAVVNEVSRVSAFDRVIIGSHHLHAIRTVRKLEPRIATTACAVEARSALYHSRLWLKLGKVEYDTLFLPPWSGWQKVVFPRFVRIAHEYGLAFHVWTVNEIIEMKKFLEWGVDGLITDRPDLALSAVGRESRQAQKLCNF